MPWQIKSTTKDMNFFKQLIEQEKLKSIIDKTFSHEQKVSAHVYVIQGHTEANVIISVNQK